MIVAAAGLCSCLRGQVPTRQFRPGDFVAVRNGNVWQPCVVSSEYHSATRDYLVSCGAQDLFVPGDGAHMRARKSTPEDVRAAAETDGALQRRPRPGNGPGVRYGTREPRECPSRAEPVKGAPSPEQARQYFICEIEAERVTSLTLVTGVKLEVAPSRTFNFTTDSGHPAIDSRQPVHDIRGSFKHYDCREPRSSDNAFARAHNCSAFEERSAQGICYKNTFGDWHCMMRDLNADILHPSENLLPPEGN
jgi:hypothetical protein